MGGFKRVEAACRRVVSAGRSHGGERPAALKARVYPASMPAGGESFFFSLCGLVLTLSQLTTRDSGFHGLI